MLATLVAATVVLWAMSTVRHMVATETRVEDQQGKVSYRKAA